MSDDYAVRQCDILVIGGGGSGALAAVEASKQQNLKIILASKGPVGQSGLTPTANGGTAFASTPEETLQEMLTAGDFVNDQSLVWLMANQADSMLETVQSFGITTTPIRPTSRCILPGDLLSTLRQKLVKADNVDLLEDVLITRIFRSDQGISAAAALNLTSGDFFVLQAKVIVMASGGLVGELYPYTSNNPFGVSTDSSGTGHAMAYLAGAELMDMELIQFVPLPGNPKCLNLRYFPEFWDGPYLNNKGEEVESDLNAYQGKSYNHLFVQKLFREIEKGNGPLYIDRRDTPRTHSLLKVKSFDRRRKYISNLGLDPHQNKIQINIGSHFGMGGIRVNEKLETNIEGLFAAGEVMSGVHGGLRLPGYSFTQMMVFGFEAGKQAALSASQPNKIRDFSREEVEQERKRVFNFLAPKKQQVSLGELKKELQQIMQEHVFVLRDKAGLEKALAAIAEVKNRTSRLVAKDFKRFNLEWARSIEFELMVEMAAVITQSALAREESRGFHFRRDFPAQDNDNWLKHTRARRKENRCAIETSPVEFPYLKPEGLL